MMGNFEKCLLASLRWEGGWTNHPRDPGGATMYGVTQRVYDGWRRGIGKPVQSVRQISEAEKRTIYRELYADKVRFEALPSGVDCAVLDAAINSGPARAAQWLQRALGVVVDGNIGPATVAAAIAYPDPRALVRAIMALRRAFLRHLKTFDVFGKGWLARCADIERVALALAGGAAVKTETLAQPTMRARIEDAKPRPSKTAGDVAVGAGATTTIAAGALVEAKDALVPLAGNGGWIDGAIAALAIGGVAIAIGGLAWRQYQQHRASAHAQALDLPAQVAA